MLTYFMARALGGALGSMARFWVSGLVATSVGGTFPWGTIIINITGSFVIGLFSGLMSPPEGRWLASSNTRVFLTYGICGGYTTFSSFSLQTLTLAQDRQWARAGANVGLSVVLCLMGVWLGYVLAMKN